MLQNQVGLGFDESPSQFALRPKCNLAAAQKDSAFVLDLHYHFSAINLKIEYLWGPEENERTLFKTQIMKQE